MDAIKSAYALCLPVAHPADRRFTQGPVRMRRDDGAYT
jgi:hypothetical protein